MGCRLLSIALGLSGLALAHGEDLVVARSTANSDYLRTRLADGKRQPQTYVFMPGRYFAGITRDRTLDSTTFRTIAERLVPDLRQQDFFPAPSLPKADLLLVVHWGVTTGNQRDTVAISTSMDGIANIARESEQRQRDLDEAIAAGDLEGAGRARDSLTTLEQETRGELRELRRQQGEGDEDSATLLGLNAELQKPDTNPFGDSRRQAIVEMTGEERYFVVVMAYDAQVLVKTKQLKRVWTMRTSIGSAGVNFHQALDRMSHVASRYFGTRQDELLFEHTGDRKRQEVIRYGDLIVVGTVDQ